MFPHTDGFLEMFPHTGDIHTPVSGHCEVAALLERVNNRKTNSYVKLNLKIEDYYRIKDGNEDKKNTMAGQRMNRTDLHMKLRDLQDLKYRDMQIKIIPTVNPESIIGVRTPELKTIAKEILKSGEYAEFLNDLPHEYFEENQLHAFIISGMKNFDECMTEVEYFLPYIDNWATCDQMSPKAFKKHRGELLKRIKKWIRSDKTYNVRFGVGMLMEHFLDEDYDPEYPEIVAGLRSEEYYVKMMIAWYFATALAKQYESVLPFIEEKRLDDWTHNKTIQKSIESNRITVEQKQYLKSLKVPNK